MDKRHLNVMISSTALDLPDHRKEVRDACLSSDMFPKMMEHLPANDADAIAVSLGMVEEADIYLGVFAHRYGHVPAGHDISITEMEYNRAVERGIPRLIFLMSDAHDVRPRDVEKGAGGAKLDALRERLRQGHVVKEFDSAADLRAHVIRSLVELQRRSGSEAAPLRQEPQPEPYRGFSGSKNPRPNPYHCDRSEQVDQIAEALNSRTRDSPIVFIVHGDEDQCHDTFLERLRDELLPKSLALDPNLNCIQEYVIELPNSRSNKELFRKKLLRNLHSAVHEGSTAAPDVIKIAETLARLDQPVLIQALLLTHKLGKDKQAIIGWFEEFWADWPIHDAKFHRLVFLEVFYVLRPGVGWFSWFHRWNQKRENARLRQVLGSPERRSGPSRAVILDELRGVTEEDLRVWAKRLVEQKVRGARDLLVRIESLCKQPGFLDHEHRVAMAKIAKELGGPGVRCGADWEAW
jgi:hypothetical protein